MDFQGTFEFTLDAKNRLTIPAAHRAAFSDGLVLAPGLDACVSIWRPADYTTWQDGVLAGKNPLLPETRKFARALSANSKRLELDGAGRVMVPPFLLRHAHLEREVTLIGARRCLEIWDRERWNADNDEVLANFSELAAGLGGGG